MRFITEFELDGRIDTSKLNYLIPDKKHIRELGIGQEIGRSFGWKEGGFLNKNELIDIRYSLEIEAFPMDKWLEFKERILDIKLYYPSDIRVVEQHLKDLESFSKPEHYEQSKTTK